MAKKVIANITKIADVEPQMDDTDKQAVSFYGEGDAVGDTSAKMESAVNQNLRVAIFAGTSLIGQEAYENDARPNTSPALHVRNYQMVFNETTVDRIRNNAEYALLASASRTGDTNSADQINYNGRGLIVYVDFATEEDTVTLTPRLQIKDSISGAYFTIWAAAANLTAVGDTTYLFAPGGAAGSYTEAVNLRLPRTWRFQMGASDTDQAGYSVSAAVLV